MTKQPTQTNPRVLIPHAAGFDMHMRVLMTELCPVFQHRLRFLPNISPGPPFLRPWRINYILTVQGPDDLMRSHSAYCRLV